MSAHNTLRRLWEIKPQPLDYNTNAFQVKVNNAGSRLLDKDSKTYSKLEVAAPFDKINGKLLLIEHLRLTAVEEYRPGFGPTVWLHTQPAISKEALVWCPDVINHTLASLIRHNDTTVQGLRGTIAHGKHFYFRLREGGTSSHQDELSCHLAYVEDRSNALMYFAKQKECPPRLREMLLAKVDFWKEQLRIHGTIDQF